MDTLISLKSLPVIAFSARVSGDQLSILQVEGGLLASFGATSPPARWLLDAIPADQRSAFIAPQATEAGQLIRLRAPDGGWRWFKLRVGTFRNVSDGIEYAGILADASAYKALEEAAQRYRDYAELSSDWYWETDDAHRFSYFSREFDQVAGVSSATALGRTRWDSLGQERLGNVDWDAHRQAMFEHKPIRNFEYPSRRTNGRIVWFRVSGRPRHDENGKFLGYHGIAADISAARRIEERMQQAEHLASIGQLAAGVAHEINNPLGFVRSNLETLGDYLSTLLALVERYAVIETAGATAQALAMLEAERQAADIEFLREDAPALLDECRDGLERVRKIVADLREFSREGDADWSEVDIHACLESAINLFAGGLPKRIELQRHYATLPPLRCRPLQLNQVFLALLANAATAIGDQPGCITVSSGRGDGDEAWVEVSDTGHGIAAEHLPRLFEPFFSTRPVGKGTGMGLARSFGIVADHGGRIEVHSAPGAGASFRVILPQQATRKTA